MLLLVGNAGEGSRGSAGGGSAAAGSRGRAKGSIIFFNLKLTFPKDCFF